MNYTFDTFIKKFPEIKLPVSLSEERSTYFTLNIPTHARLPGLRDCSGQSRQWLYEFVSPQRVQRRTIPNRFSIASTWASNARRVAIQKSRSSASVGTIAREFALSTTTFCSTVLIDEFSSPRQLSDLVRVAAWEPLGR